MKEWNIAVLLECNTISLGYQFAWVGEPCCCASLSLNADFNTIKGGLDCCLNTSWKPYFSTNISLIPMVISKERVARFSFLINHKNAFYSHLPGIMYER